MGVAKQKVTARALVQRLRRRLARDGEQLLTCRENSQWFRDLGRYYTVNGRNHIQHTDIDLEALGRELEVLADWEELAND